eukprot:gene41104-50147_t
MADPSDQKPRRLEDTTAAYLADIEIQYNELCKKPSLPLVAEKKGKLSKHKHSIGYSEPLESLLEPGHFFISEKKAYSMPPSVQNVLIQALDKLMQKSSLDLQQCVADTSSCAILTFLLRILSNPKLLPKGTGLTYLSQLLEKVMYVSPSITAEADYVRSGDSRAHDLFYAMAGDKMGSYFLETLFEACPVHVFENLMTEFAFHVSPEA